MLYCAKTNNTEKKYDNDILIDDDFRDDNDITL